MNALEEISQHRVPCGPMTVAASGVCRRRLRDSYDRLLDRLTEEIHQEYRPPEVPKNHKFDEKGEIVHKDELAKRKQTAKTMQESEEKVKKEREKNAPHSPEILESKRERLLQESMMKVDVKKQMKEYEERLMGNSKMLQRQDGKIEKR
jgi:hypothetical protein